jgi:hypothetical protein
MHTHIAIFTHLRGDASLVAVRRRAMSALSSLTDVLAWPSLPKRMHATVITYLHIARAHTPGMPIDTLAARCVALCGPHKITQSHHHGSPPPAPYQCAIEHLRPLAACAQRDRLAHNVCCHCVDTRRAAPRACKKCAIKHTLSLSHSRVAADAVTSASVLSVSSSYCTRTYSHSPYCACNTTRSQQHQTRQHSHAPQRRRAARAVAAGARCRWTDASLRRVDSCSKRTHITSHQRVVTRHRTYGHLPPRPPSVRAHRHAQRHARQRQKCEIAVRVHAHTCVHTQTQAHAHAHITLHTHSRAIDGRRRERHAVRNKVRVDFGAVLKHCIHVRTHIHTPSTHVSRASSTTARTLVLQYLQQHRYVRLDADDRRRFQRANLHAIPCQRYI